MRRIIIKASDVAAVIGQNKFKPREEVFNELWKKHSPENFNLKTKSDEAKEALAKSYDAQKIVALATSHKAKNSTDAEQTFRRASILIAEDQTLSADDKVKVTEHLRSKVYTSHGTRTEDRTADETGLTLVKDTSFYNYEICIIGDNQYVVTGKIDRIEEHPDGSKTLVEIKNRTKALFRRVYPSEMIQIQTYLHMLDLDNAKLIEQFNSEINTMKVERDRDMWNNEIAPSLEVFCNDLDRVFLV